MNPKKISNFIMMGDSLSDRGTMENRYLLGIIPMSWVSGLRANSPQGRFTNGLAWSDHISARIANQFLINELQGKGKDACGMLEDMDAADKADYILEHRLQKPKLHLDATDIADAVINHDRKFQKLVKNNYFLSDNRFIKYKGIDFVRNYDEGGLTAHDYSWVPSLNPVLFFTRLILATLSMMREKLLAYDRVHKISRLRKLQTLVVEWSGANDLFSVNARPSKHAADIAIADRLNNAEQLIKHGYHHFILFNLPDLSLTPFYQLKSEEERKNAHDCSIYFNEQLATACGQLAKTYPHISMDVFDIGSLFTHIYENPAEYGFEKEKLITPYIKSQDFEITKDRTSPASGYMFWDDVHPSADLHAILAENFYRKYQFEYNFIPPRVESLRREPLDISAQDLRASFINKYEKKLQAEQAGFFGSFRRSNINYRNASLVEILQHALHSGGQRTRDVIIELQWIDTKGNLNLNIPALKVAMAVVMAKAAVYENSTLAI